MKCVLVALLAVVVGAPAWAAPPEPAASSSSSMPDITKPLYTKDGAPICLTEDALDTLVKVLAEAPNAANGVAGCGPASGGLRALYLKGSGWLSPDFQVLLMAKSGQQVKVWTLPEYLKN